MRIYMHSISITAILSMGGCGPTPFDDDLYRAPGRLEIPPLVSEAEADRPADAQGELRFEGVSELEVDRLVADVLRRSPSLEAMEHAWRAAAARPRQVGSLDDPMLAAMVAPESLSDPGIEDGYDVVLGQKIPWPGKLSLRRDIAQRQADAAHEDYAGARNRLIDETRRVFYEYYYVYRAIEVNDTNLDLLREFQLIAESKYAAGTASKQDALQAQVARFQLERRAIELERSRRVSAAWINALLHRRPQADLPPPPQKVPAPYPLPPIDPLHERAVNSRPELQAIAQRLHAARLGRDLARKEYFPDVTVMGTYNTMWMDTEHQWMVGAALDVPIQIGRRRAGEAEALSESLRMAADLAAGVDEVMLQVTEAYETVAEGERVIRLYEAEFLPAARQSLEAARAGYVTDRNDFLTMLAAERDLFGVELDYQQSLAQYHQQWADLARAVGADVNP